MEGEFRKALQGVTINKPSIKVIRNVDAELYHNREDIIEGLVRQLYSPVMFEKSVSSLPKDL